MIFSQTILSFLKRYYLFYYFSETCLDYSIKSLHFFPVGALMGGDFFVLSVYFTWTYPPTTTLSAPFYPGPNQIGIIFERLA